MNMQKSKILIFITLVLLITGLFYSESLGAIKWDYKAPQELDGEVVAKSAPPKAAIHQKEAIIRPKVEYKAEGLKDPFQPFITEKETVKTVTPSLPSKKTLPALTVQGLIWGGDFPQAIINNKLVKIGDSVEEAEVTAIEKDGVTLLYTNRTYKLPSPQMAVGQSKKRQIKGGSNENEY